MPIYDNINGVWHKVQKQYDNINGIQREVQNGYSNVNGVWRKDHSAGSAVAQGVSYNDSYNTTTSFPNCCLNNDAFHIDFTKEYGRAELVATFKLDLSLSDFGTISDKGLLIRTLGYSNLSLDCYMNGAYSGGWLITIFFGGNPNSRGSPTYYKSLLDVRGDKSNNAYHNPSISQTFNMGGYLKAQLIQITVSVMCENHRYGDPGYVRLHIPNGSMSINGVPIVWEAI